MFKLTTKLTTLLVVSIVFSVSLVSCTTTPAQTPREALLEKLNKAISQDVIMLGHQDATAYGHSWSYQNDRSDVYDIVEDYPAVMGWDLGDIEFGHENNLDGVPFELIRNEIIKQHSRGGINTISWHAYNPCGGTAWDEEPGVVTSILSGGENYEMFQQRLAKVADFLASLKDSEGRLIPVIFRPWHEHNGDWFWWGDKWCTREQYRALWDMTYNFMAQRNLDNIVWSYMPMGGAEDKDPKIEQYDMVGFDEYPHKDAIELYKKNFKEKMAVLKNYHDKYDKIIAVSETGYETMPMDNWFTTVVLPMIENEPVSYILFWRNAWDKPDHFFCSYKGHSSESDFESFVASEKIVTVKDIESL